MAQWESSDLRANELAPRKRTFFLPPKLALTVVTGPDRGQTLPLGRGVHRVGTLDDCDLVLSDRQVSRHHLELRVGDDGVELRDLGSRNGSFHHGARFSSIVVGVGAVVALGRSELRIGAVGASGPALLPSVRTSAGELKKSTATAGPSATVRRVAAGRAALRMRRDRSRARIRGGDSVVGRDQSASPPPGHPVSSHRRSITSPPGVCADSANDATAYRSPAKEVTRGPFAAFSTECRRSCRRT